MRYLKQLVLHGYKTFASRTEFLFDAGVTAIVGPNGSGKSNVADALRWVLGEQSFSALRSKRTEDMIFSGSEQRARMGMATVSLVLDNSSGWLPTDFAEVEISRRAYRSGDNEYYINGNRVRLRDIAELLGSSGLAERTYSVIGQGLVDQALSQRPEERRRLFEEAAGITAYQAKREQAAQKLSEAGSNLTRARDIINELTPRLRYLKGQARRALEYQQLRRDLEAHLQTWYGYRWNQAAVTLHAAKERASEAATTTSQATQAMNSLLEQVAARRAERAELRDRLSEWHRESSGLHREAEAVQRELAVRTEQLRMWREQEEELRRELVYLRTGLEDGDQRLRSAEAQLLEARSAHEAEAGRVADAQRELETRERQRRAQEALLAQRQDAALACRTQLAERQSRLAQLADRRAELNRSDGEQAAAIQGAAAQASSLQKQAEELSARSAELATASAAIDLDRQAHSQALAAAQGSERSASERSAAAQRALGRLQDQRDMLVRLRDEGAGLGSGARAVISAARADSLKGILGTLGDLIEVPAELERAVEATLGGRLQDVVVDHWEDAEQAVAFLKRNQAGRATFLPLDSLRPSRAIEPPKGVPGVVGVASELVRCDSAIRPAVELALNHSLVVSDLPTARRLLGRVGATLVTLEGELVRPGGSVTGGNDSRGRDSGLLARARTLRELPAQIRAAEAQVTAIEAEVAEARRLQGTARALLEELRVKREEISASQARLADQQNAARLALERAQQTRMWHEERRRALAQEIAAVEKQEGQLQTALGGLSSELEAREGEANEARRRLAESATDDLVAQVARLRAEAAVSAGQLRSYEARVRELSAAQNERARDISAKEARITALSAQEASASESIETLGGAAQALAARTAGYAAQIEPAEARIAKLEAEQRQSEAQERTLREHLRLAQMHQSQADLAVQRAYDEQTHLRSEIEKDLGLVELIAQRERSADVLADSQPPLPLNGMVTRLPVVVEIPEGLDSDVRSLRAQIARLGPVNPEALTEYNEVEARYNFLTTQSADLERAVASLEQVITELDKVMEREFLAAFKAIAAQFKQEFANLFGGGAAKLVLSDPESPNTTGVEIIARPPGKREQGLALLSGGERALTAAALIFSILKTRPTPFCVLDEVDAALDEANVGRFREALRGLSAQTQFILVTHNRGTIEVADTIYGISMGSDNSSQTISLRLDGRELVPASVGDD